MDVNIKEVRDNFQKLGGKYKPADDISINKDIIQNVTSYWFFKGNFRSHKKVIIYLHGGCFVFGSIESHKSMVSHLARRTNSTILFVEYSLAPEQIYPTAINEVLKVYNFLANQLKVEDISFMGDSAGPGLMVSVVSILSRATNYRNLKRCIMISPWIDLRNTNDSITSNRNIDPVLTKDGLDFFASLYIGNNPLKEVNPIEGISGIFPPTLILVGTNEILLDDSKKLFSKVTVEQPLTELTIYEGQTHVWLMDNVDNEAAEKTFEEIKWFLSLNETKSNSVLFYE